MDKEIVLKSSWIQDGSFFIRIVVLKWFDKSGNVYKFSTHQENAEAIFENNIISFKPNDNFNYGHYFDTDKELNQSILDDYNQRVSGIKNSDTEKFKIVIRDNKKYLKRDMTLYPISI